MPRELELNIPASPNRTRPSDPLQRLRRFQIAAGGFQQAVEKAGWTDKVFYLSDGESNVSLETSAGRQGRNGQVRLRTISVCR